MIYVDLYPYLKQRSVVVTFGAITPQRAKEVMKPAQGGFATKILRYRNVKKHKRLEVFNFILYETVRLLI